MTMLNVYDLTRKKSAVLQNAFNIVETHELNQIYTLSFTLPATDEKNQYCQPRHYVRWGEDGELYRIKTPKVNESDTSAITYECEHVITTLCDNVMFGSFQYGGQSVHTRATITWLLGQQKTQNWVLDQCDFDRQFEYLWEQENLLNALYSIPKEFAAPYKWVFDTTVFPWRLSLKAIDPSVHPEYYLRARSNILSSGTDADYANICTRIYPLGYGEGVNQLNIKDVNNGVPYLQSPAAYTNKYGIVEKVLVDRRFENADLLKAYAQSMLDLYQEPSMSRTFDVTDLYQITKQAWDEAEVGKICKMTQDDTTAYITKCKWQRDVAGDLQIDLSTKATDIAQNVADLADRVRIESVYAQGATQLYQHSKDANATPSKGMILSLYFPSEMKQINKVLLRLKLNKFRAYSQTTENGGASTQTSSGGSVSGSTSQATGSGSFSATSTTTSDAVWSGDDNWVKAMGDSSTGVDTSGPYSSNPGYVETQPPNSTDYNDHRHYVYEPYPHYHKHNPTVYIYKRNFAHSHNVSVSLSDSQTSHTHNFNIGGHTHKVDIPAHTHKITAGIFESGNPTGFDIYVGNTKKATINAKSYDGDITPWLLNNKNQVPRNSWIEVKIVPNDLAYVVSSVFVQGFVQSRGGGNY